MLSLYRMKEHFRNIIRIIVAFIMLAGGNFAFALAHGDCLISSDKHITCEMECCKENPCIEDESDGTVKIVDETNSCCKTHIEQAAQQDVSLPVITNTADNSRTIFYSAAIFLNELSSTGFAAITHKHKTTNILLITSVFRI